MIFFTPPTSPKKALATWKASKILFLKQITLLLLLSGSFFQLSGQTIQLGSGTATTSATEASPVNIWYRSLRQQIVYTKQELQAAGFSAGFISELGFYVETAPTHNLPNYKIYLGTTNQREASPAITSGLDLVYTNSSYAPTPGGFDNLTLDSTWFWDGTSNIVVNICFDRVPNYNSSGTVRYYNDSNYVSTYTRSDGSNQCGSTPGSTTDDKPLLQLTYSGTAPNDAGIAAINLDSVVCTGSQSIQAQIINYGTNQINSLTVNWSVNGVAQTPFSTTTTIDTLNSTAGPSFSANLGNFTFAAGNSYTFKVWSSQPNGQLDTVNLNDTITFTATAGLGGTYTIGGSSPDYATLNNAVNELELYGICASVVFNIRAGTYFEQLPIGSISGASATQTVTFKSETNDSSDVIISLSTSSSNNYLVELDNTSFIQFEHLTFEALSTSYGRLITMIGTNRGHRFKNCRFIGVSTGSASSIRSIVYVINNTLQDVEFSQNRFEEGSNALYLDGNNQSAGLEISQNQFIEPFDRGIYVYDIDSVNISDNYLRFDGSNSSAQGIEVFNSDGPSKFNRNWIHGIRGGIGLQVFNSDGTASSRGEITNNFIQMGSGTSFCTGLEADGLNYYNIAHNTVNITGSGTTSRAFYSDFGGNLSVQNNIFAADQGYAMEHNGNNTVFNAINFNGYFSNGSTLAEWNGVLAQNLADVQAASAGDSNSLEVNPFFIQDSLYTTAQIAFNNSATPLPYVITDIEGETRSATTPDIGADEFSPTGVDAGVVEIIAPTVPFAPGTYPLKAVLRNFGATTITSATINWTQNGILQTAVNFNGSLASGDTTLVNLGNLNFTAGAVYNFTVYSQNTNSLVDAQAVNDTAKASDIAAGLGGSFTIGGASPDFADFTTAISALNLGGIYAPVTFEVRNGTYNEYLAIESFPRANSFDSVVFKGENNDSSLVTISYAATFNNQQIVQINNAHHLGFKHLSFVNTSAFYGRVFYVLGNAHNLQFTSLVLENTTSAGNSTSTQDALFSEGSSSVLDSISFNRVHFKNGSYGIYLVGGTFSNYAQHFAVTQSVFENFYYMGMRLQYVEDVVLSNNRLQTTSAYSSTYGVFLDDLRDLQFTQNRLFSKNNIRYGILLSNVDGNNLNPQLVANNFVSLGSTNLDYGIAVSGCSDLEISHNSLWVYSSGSTAKPLEVNSSNSNLAIFNNIFQNTGAGYAVFYNSTFGVDANTNNLFSNGTNLAYSSGTDYANLNAFASASGLDTNSLSENALYTDTFDLHTNNANLNAAGTPRAGITHDIDNEPRDVAAPDIGADEFAIPTDDAALLSIQAPVAPFTPGIQPVKVQLFNNGADTLQSVTIQWEVNGVAQPPYNWTGSLPSGVVADSVELGNFNFNFSNTYNLKAFVQAPNGNTDAQPLNDTIEKGGLRAALSGLYTIGGTTADYGSFNAAVNDLELRGIAGWVSFAVEPGVYNEQVSLGLIQGVTAKDTITFRSQNNDSSSVSLQYSPGSENYVLALNEAKHIQFKNFKIHNSASFYSRAVVIDSGASHLSFTGMRFSSQANNTSSTNAALVYNDGGFSNSPLTFQQSTFAGGAYGLFAYGNFSNEEDSLRVVNNQFLNQFYRGLQLDEQDHPFIVGNYFRDAGVYSTYYAAYIFDNNFLNFSSNQIIAQANGVYFDDIFGSSTDSSLIANNFISIDAGNLSVTGLELRGSNQIKVLFNSVLVATGSANSIAFEERGNTNPIIYNNIFQNNSNGYAVYVSSSFSSAVAGWNNLYSPQAPLGYWGGSDAADLASWQSLSGLDTNSISLDAQFEADTNLHTTLASLNGAATPQAQVTVDFDGETRDPLTPDIGADEFTPATDEASLISFNGPSAPFAAGPQTVYVTLLNNGADTLRSVTLEWEVNGQSQTSYNWNGALPSGQTLDSIPVGTYSFMPATAHDVVVYSTFPNNVPDQKPENDTAKGLGLYPALSGFYSIGANQADFQSFNNAATALHAGGVIGWVTFNVQAGSYSENLTFNEILGASALDSITFQSLQLDSSTVQLSGSGNPVITFDGGSHIHFKEMTLAHSASSSSRVVDITGTSQNLSFEKVAFSVPVASNYFNSYLVYVNNNELHANLRFNRCSFTHARAGIFGVGSFSYRHSGFSLQRSVFNDQEDYAIYLDDFDAPYLKNNQLINNQNNFWYGIYFNDVQNDFYIGENRVYSAYQGHGIYINDANGSSSQPGLLANNFITLGDSASATVYGINLRYSNDVNVYYNSINLLSANTSNAGYGLYFLGNNSLDIRNNLSATSAGGFPLYSNSTSFFSALDYNNYYNGQADVVNLSGTSQTLTAWQTASGAEANSLTANPGFSSARDLHISQSLLDSAGTPISAVTTDIDQETRNATNPDIGADEVLFFPDDLSVNALTNLSSDCSLPDSSRLQIRIGNNGTNAQSNFNVVLIVNADTTTETYARTLAGGATDTFSFAPYIDFSSIQAYDIKVYTQSGNDTRPVNDTLEKTIFHFAPPVANISDDTSVCRGATVNLQVSGGQSYLWSSGQTVANIFVTPNATTTYLVTLTDVNGCSLQDSVTVTVSDAADTASLRVLGNTTICAGDSLMLVSTNPQNIIWSTQETNDTIYVKEAGTYSLQLNKPGDACDGRVFNQVVVNTVDDSIRVNGNGLTTVCAGDPVILTATNFNSGLWSTGATTATITIYPTTDTTITAVWIGSAGCTLQDTISITVTPAVPPAKPTNLTPVNQTLNVTNPITVSWAPAANAVVYDVYVWRVGQSRPNFPKISGFNGISSSVSVTGINQTFNWQVAARNSCFTTFSDTNTFTTIGKPDLIIDSLSIPASAFSGTNITITYRVRNIGNQGTGSQSWDDHIWLSSDEDLRLADDILLVEVPNLTYLDTGQSYTNTVTVQLPQRIISTHLLFVSADNDDAFCATSGWTCFPGAPRGSHNRGFSELNEQNNFLYDTLPIVPSPTPDIVVNQIGAPANAFSGDNITLTYQVKNQGQVPADIFSMSECFYISPDSFPSSNAIPLSRVISTGGIGGSSGSSLGGGSGGGGGGGGGSSASLGAVGGSTALTEILEVDSLKTRTANLSLPNNIFGRYFLFVEADCKNQIFEGFYEGNNNGITSIELTLRPPPDLVVDSIQLPATAIAGQDLFVDWTIDNIGGNNPTYSWRDSVYLCSTPIFNPDSVLVSASRSRLNPLLSGGSVSFGSSGSSGSGGGGSSSSGSTYISTTPSGFRLSIPNGVSGNYFLFVKTDSRDDVFEYIFENNNEKRSTNPVAISLAPLVDLQPESLSTSVVDTLYADSIESFSYVLKNYGVGTAKAIWYDKVLLSSSATSNGNGHHLATLKRNNDLLAGNSRNYNTNFVVPNLAAGMYYLQVQTDVDDDVYEHQAEANNAASTAATVPQGFYLKPRAANSSGSGTTTATNFADLEALSGSGSASGNSGQPVTVNWAAQNNGPFNISRTIWWQDDIFLSTDTLLSSGDVFLGNKRFSGGLSANANYSATQSVNLPNGISGNYHLIVKVANQGNFNFSDTVTGNNVVHFPINVSLTPPPDLVVSNFTLPTMPLYGGQQFYLPFTITNQGTGAVTQTNLRNAVFLNGSPIVQGGINIGVRDTVITIAPNSSYSDSVLLSVPAYASGNYFVVFNTDDGNGIFEYTNENNNSLAKALFLNPASQLNTDLVVESLSAPDTMLLGYEYTIPYSFRNEGINTAIGPHRDAFYFGQGSTFNSATDGVFATKNVYSNLPSGNSQADSLVNRVIGAQAQSYFGIGRLNINANLVETSLANNDSTLAQPIVVDAQELFVSVPDTNSMGLNNPVYYKVNVSAGKDLLVSLNSLASQNGINELYVSYNSVPSATNFDFRQRGGAGLDQQVLVPNTQAGYYYIFANTLSSFSQEVELLAEELPYSIISISPSTVGQGIVTTTVNGAGFRPGGVFTLEDAQGNPVDTASVVAYSNSMEVSLRWNLTNTAKGTYTVVSTNPDSSRATLANGLTVEEASSLEPYMYVNAPKIIRTGKSAFFTFFIENTGNIDIPYIKGDISVPDYVNISSYQINGTNLFTPAVFGTSQIPIDDWRNYGTSQQLPYLVKDLQPGKSVSVDVTFKNFPFARFPYRLRGVGSSTTNFLNGFTEAIEAMRQALLNGEDTITQTALLNLYYDQQGFLDSVINLYVRNNLIDTGDTTGLLAQNCTSCGGGYDFSPGGSPGQGRYNTLQLDTGKTMLWEINHPNGTPGGELGWDVITALSTINVAATAANPFKIDLKTLSSWDNTPDFLTTWEPGYDKCWPLFIAQGGITNFAANKFVIDDTQFKDNTPLYGGSFSLSLSGAGDTLYLCFNAATPAAGQMGWPGGDGQYGQDGGRGGPGGPCSASIAPGPGGPGGLGGPGVGGYLPAGNGGAGGPGGLCNSGSYGGGAGGTGGSGGLGGDGQNGGSGGDGGNGGFPGGPGGDGGDGGPSGPGGAPGPGGPGGPGDPNPNPGPGPGPDGPDGPDGPGPDNPDNPNNPDSPNYPPPGPPTPPPGGPPGGPNGPNGPGNPPPGPPGGPNGPPAGCGGGSGGGGGQSPCDTWNDINSLAGCATAGAGCGELLGKAAALGTLVGPGGTAVGAGLGIAGCLLGAYNCFYGGNAVTNCIAAGISIATGSVSGSVADASACAQNILCDESEVRGSCDPNEIEGPLGFGPNRMVANDTTMQYTIFFENDPELATTSAQRVIVRQKVHPNMNPFSLRLTEFGFANLNFTVPNVPNYTTTLDLTDTLGVDVQMTGGFDVVTSEFFWIFQSIDKSTGLPPLDPLAGFLAINDSIGSGEGFVKYTVVPRVNQVNTGDSITAQASIVFDVNKAIITNTEFNTIDAVAPNSVLDSLAPNQDSVTFPICWSYQDDPGGSGVNATRVWASENGGPFVNVAEVFAPDTCYLFTGSNLKAYDFYTQALDNVGKVEAPKGVDQSTVINAFNLELLNPTDTTFCVGDTAAFNWVPDGINLVNLSYQTIGDTVFYPIATAVDSLSQPFKWVLPDSLGNGFYRFRVSDTSNTFAFVGDSVAVGSLPSLSLTADVDICLGDTIQLVASGGSQYSWDNTAGLSDTAVANPMASPVVTTSYIVEAFNAAGCSVRDTVTVTVNSGDTTYTSSFTCNPSLVGINSTVYSNSLGCDSLVIDTVVLQPTFTDTLSAIEICANDSALIFGNYQNQAGFYTDSAVTANGCDSVTVQHLMVKPVLAGDTSLQRICAGDSLLIFGNYETTAGLYQQTLTGANGCDSVTSLRLAVDPVFTVSTAQFICTGDSAFLAGQFRTMAGVYVDTFSTASGCDSIISTTLNIGGVKLTNLSASICAGDSLFIAGAYRKTAGLFTDTVSSTTGCDSVTNTTLTVNPVYSTNDSLSICAGDSAFLAGQFQTMAGVYVDTFSTASGCDSIISTTLNIGGVKLTNLSASICAGDSLFIAGAYRKTAGLFTDTVSSTTGCDSVTSTTLTVNPVYSTNNSLSICAGDSAFLAGQFQKMAGVYVDTLSTAEGCDSIVSLALTVIEVDSTVLQVTRCGSYIWPLTGDTLSTTGNYSEVLSNTNGCDSVVVLDLTITPAPTWYLDADADGYYTSLQQSCTSPGTGWSTTVPAGGAGDCNDTNMNVNPGAVEICGNGIDDDCVGGDSICPGVLIPEIRITGNGTEITSGSSSSSVADDTYFGSVGLFGQSVTHTFTIKNSGTAALNLTGVPVVVLSGPQATDFTVSQPSSTTLNAADSVTFTIVFDPIAAGLRSATVSIANNDADENPYTFVVEGQGASSNNNPNNAFFNARGCLDCHQSAVRDTFELNGVWYTVVDRAMLDSMVTFGGDFTKVCVSKVTDMNRLFLFQSNFNQNISAWDVSNVTDMTGMFALASIFNQDIGNWDVSSVLDMYGLFFRARAFNQDIGNWDVSNVNSMNEMFHEARSFNQNIGGWDVSQVTNMDLMFQWANAFNQDIGGWDVSQVSSMMHMFNRAATFDQDIGAWDVYNVANMLRMFNGALVFNQDLTNWCVPKIRTEPTGFATGGSVLSASNKPRWGTCPFTGTCLPNNLNAAFNANGCLECNNYAVGDEFDLNGNCYTVVNRAMLDSMVTNGGDFTRVCVSKVTDMSGLFDRAVFFNQDIGAWDVSNVTNMNIMFRFARSFNQDIGNWDVSNVTSMGKMFQNAFVFNQDIGNWDVSGVSSMAFMFLNARAFNHNIGSWDVSNVSSMIKMFKNAQAFNQDLTPWCVSLIPVRPLEFSNGSILLPVNEPAWGNCPPPSTSSSSASRNGNGGAGITATPWYVFKKDDLIYLSLPKTGNNHKVEIYSTNGQQVARFTTDQNEVEILSDAPPGVYLIRYNDEIQRAVKQP